ncbi:THO complex subunit 5 [Nesidiocoris tenuis]|uniref:THO complex subunit 5 n=1 Tax=Nesidiocoris tenuis TaxID=355587 RepID=A0ABN7AZ29_9HEMI|nr:THO complex subunit 5 [Nesidiocoris tenuis]
MSKETEVVAVVKKRKPDVADDTNNGTETTTTNDEKKPIYQRVSAAEENEAMVRDPVADLEQYQTICKEFAEHLIKIGDLKANKPDGWYDEVIERRMEVSLLAVHMKKLNRIEKIRNKNARERVTKVRQQVDVLQLQLQNLMCEIQHLNREVDKCLMFKKKPLGVDLVPLEQFYAEAPEKITRSEVTKNDEHQLLLARLEWELQQRKELSSLCSELDGKKKSLTSQINKRQADIDSLAPLIKEVLNVTKPLQEKLGYSPWPNSMKSDRASLLPHPLYFLYMQSEAYKEASDSLISVEIQGNDDAAREKMKESTNHRDRTSPASGDESDGGGESSENKPKKESEKLEKRRARLLAKHPLTVLLKISFKDGSSLDLEFAYIVRLNIMTVVPKLNLTNFQLKGTDTGDLLVNKDILANLFVGDCGTDSPNVSNYYQLKEVGLDKLDTDKLGHPYVWVQKIGGLDFTTMTPNKMVEAKLETAKSSIPSVIKVLRHRIINRVALAKQAIALESKNVRSPTSMKSVKLSCSIKSWKSLSYETFLEHPAAAFLRENFTLTPQDIYFCGSISRGKAKLSVLTVVPCDYPKRPPTHALLIEWNDQTLNSTNSPHVMDMEREVNVYLRDFMDRPLWAATLLIYQIHRIMVNFDIFLECNDPPRYSSEKKTVLHPRRGRTRCLPYTYADIGEGVFLHRRPTLESSADQSAKP